jgi:hypothetical protein
MQSDLPPAPAPNITIVSGLPRSGTSMMMRMIQAAGIPALTDHLRAADEDNPHGYFELEAVKRTRQDPSWLSQAGGKVVVGTAREHLRRAVELRARLQQRMREEFLKRQSWS